MAKQQSAAAANPDKPLSLRQARFVAGYLQHGVGSRAATEAGYSPRSAADVAHRLLNEHSGVMAVVAAVREVVAQNTEYDSTKAMQEAERGMDLAIEKNQMNAYMKGVELRAKIMGVLRDQMDLNIKHIDIASALAEAQKRIVYPNQTPIEGVEYTRVPDPFER